MYTNRAILPRRKFSKLPLPQGSILTSIAAIPAMSAGGPGSGCVGPTCGRKRTGGAGKEVIGEMPMLIKETLRYRQHQPKGLKALDPTDIREYASQVKESLQQGNWARAVQGVLRITESAAKWVEHPDGWLIWERG